MNKIVMHQNWLFKWYSSKCADNIFTRERVVLAGSKNYFVVVVEAVFPFERVTMERMFHLVRGFFFAKLNWVFAKRLSFAVVENNFEYKC